jgi:hypothetical protein
LFPIYSIFVERQRYILAYNFTPYINGLLLKKDYRNAPDKGNIFDQEICPCVFGFNIRLIAAAPPISRPESFPPVMVNNAPTNVMDEMRCCSLLITLRAI